MAYPLQSLCDDKKRTESALNPDDFQPKDTLDIPFWIERPEQQLAPFIFSSPHSGRCYTAEFRNASRLSELELRSSEDSYVDLLYSKVSSCGVPFIAANFPPRLSGSQS